jgi:hypothetical protein
VSIVVIAILAGAWAVALLWPWLRKRSDVQPATSIASFRNQISNLERTRPGSYRGGVALSGGGQRYVPIAHSLETPGVIPVPRTRSEVRRRRRDVLLTLCGLDLLALSAVVVGIGPVAVLMFLVAFGLTAAYVGLLVQVTRLAAERERKVRALPPRHHVQPFFETSSISS